MPWKNIMNLLLAIFTFACIVSIGIALAEKSVVGVMLAIIGIVVFMGTGFTLKRKLP